jgi:hypothetical protein
MAPENCPNCGADVPARAKACPECGACEATGWSDESRTDGLDLPDDSFDYDDYAQREFGSKKVVPRGLDPIWWITAIVLLILLALFFWRRW